MKHRRRTTVLLAAGLALSLFGGDAIARLMLDPNPANDPVLINKRLDPLKYDYPDRTRSRDPVGMRKLIRWMKANTIRSTPYNTYRPDGMHATRRALDWMLDARVDRERRKAKRVINTWTAADKRGRGDALARRMGIQLIIYNCRVWGAYRPSWQTYSACAGTGNPDPTQGHIDHIHVELNLRGARARTTFWEYQSQLSGGSGGSGGDGGGIGT